jgi:glycosyltransferase involved in cell wall biosynthesis
MLPYGVHIPAPLARDYRTKPLRMIYAGRVTQPQKRVWDFLPLVQHLLRRKVPFVFDIIGDGDEFAPLQQVLRARVPAADVHFHGRVPHREMGAKWLEHDVFIQVSDFEGTSVSMLEAMAHGVAPVVTAASSGIEGVITPRENGFIAPVGDMAAMADVIAELAGNESLLADTGREAYRTAQAYAMDSYVRKFVRILDEMVEIGDHIDYHKRYGVYSPTHPLLVQRQLLEKSESQKDDATMEKPSRGFLHSLKHWPRSKSKRGPRNDHHAA